MQLTARDRTIDLGSPVLMGVVNVTPDSFSGDGDLDSERSVVSGTQMLAEGAAIIDVGGESSRPGSAPVSVEEELKRVVPVVRGLLGRSTAVISVDTAKPEVAEDVLKVGAHIINDITGLKDERMAAIVASYKAGLVIMHMQGVPRTMQAAPHYDRVTQAVADFFRERVARALAAGIARNHIVLDPGIGFGKNFEHNAALLKAVARFRAEFDLPILIGVSRKSFVGAVTGRKAPDGRVFGTVAATAIVAYLGASIVRVHDVGPNRDALAIAEAIRQAGM